MRTLQHEIARALGGTRQTSEREALDGGRVVHVLANFVPNTDAQGNVSNFYV